MNPHIVRLLTNDLANVQSAVLRLDADVRALTDHILSLLPEDDLNLVLDRD